MKFGSTVLLLSATALATAGCGLRQEADVYQLDVASVLSKLDSASLARAAWPTNSTSVRSGGENQLIWTKRHGGDHIDCKIALTPVEEASTKVKVDCGSAPEQDTTIVPMTAELTRQAAIEVIDATLKGRPVDLEKQGETAYLWPENEGDLSPQRATPAERAAMGDDVDSEGVPEGWYE